MKRIITLIMAFFVFGLIAAPVHADGVSTSDPSAKTDYSALAATGADNRSAVLHAYLASKDSPMANEAGYFVSEADRLNLDWKLVAAIAGVESTFGQHIPTGSYNAFGWGVFTGMQDGVHFASWKDGIHEVSEGLRTRYMNKGAVTVDQIGRIYAASPTWSYKVKYFINDIEKFSSKTTASLAVTI